MATAKHIDQRGFSIDTKGKDTWRHSKAGANPVISVSDVEIAVLTKNDGKFFSIDQIFDYIPRKEVDIVLLEGFSRLVLNNEDVGKIFCVKNWKQYTDYCKKTKGEIIFFSSIKPMGEKNFRVKEDSDVYIKLVSEFINRKINR